MPRVTEAQVTLSVVKWTATAVFVLLAFAVMLAVWVAWSNGPLPRHDECAPASARLSVPEC